MLFTLLRAFLIGDFRHITRADLLVLRMSDEWLRSLRAYRS